MSLFNELKRRNVFRVGIAYIIAAWLLLQVADVVLNNIEAPGWVFSAIMLVLGLGFPIAVIFAWAFEMTPEGIKKEKDVDRSASITHKTGRKLDFTIIGVLVVAVGFLLYDKIDSPGEPAAESETAQSASQSAVQSQASAPQVVADKSIAVLPFVNLSSDPEQEFFSDGISEELLNTLAQFPGLRVAARTSSFQFKGQNQDIATIAETLKVAHILEGSVRKSGTKLRITAQLIKADDGYHLWSKTYDREMDDIFAIQDEISGAISEALKIQLALGDSTPEVVHPVILEAANTQAYEAYLRGRQLINRRGRDNLETAVATLERSLRLDSNYAPAHAQLAIATALLMRSPSSYGDLSLDEVIRGATPHIQKALLLAPDLAEAHGAQAILALNRNDLEAVIVHTSRALEQNPSYIDVMNWQQLALGYLGRYQEQNETMLRMLTADPLSIIGQLNYVDTLGREGRYQEGHQMADTLLSQFPWAGYVSHGNLDFYYEGKAASALSWFLYAFKADPGDMQSNISLIDVFISLGLYAEARRVDDGLNFRVDHAEGDFDAAIAGARHQVELDSENPFTTQSLARLLHLSGDIESAQVFFEEMLRDQDGRPIRDNFNGSLEQTLLAAFGRIKRGHSDGAKLLIEQIRIDQVKAREAGSADATIGRVDAMLAALDSDRDGVIAGIRFAQEKGMRDPLFFNTPVFEFVQNDTEFLKLKQDTQNKLKIERDKALQLVCFNNPIPDTWQPLPETCAGVENTNQ